METPELDKMHEVKDKSQAIGEFLEWLRDEKNYTVMRWSKKRDWDDYKEDDPEGDEDSNLGGIPVRDTIEQLLADYFDIDLKKVEEERRMILDTMRRGA